MYKVAIIMGSDSDFPVMKEAIPILEEAGLEYEVRIISAHRTPVEMVTYATTVKDRGFGVIIAGAGGSAHLPGMVASLTSLPVLGVPVRTKGMDGYDSALSIQQMPGGIPVAMVPINGADIAANLAVKMLLNILFRDVIQSMDVSDTFDRKLMTKSKHAFESKLTTKSKHTTISKQAIDNTNRTYEFSNLDQKDQMLSSPTNQDKYDKSSHEKADVSIWYHDLEVNQESLDVITTTLSEYGIRFHLLERSLLDESLSLENLSPIVLILTTIKDEILSKVEEYNKTLFLFVPVHSSVYNHADNALKILHDFAPIYNSNFQAGLLAINGFLNASLYAARIFGIYNVSASDKMIEYQDSLRDMVITKDKKFINHDF